MGIDIVQPDINKLSRKDVAVVTKIRLAKTDGRIMLMSVARARGELEGVVEIMGAGDECVGAAEWGAWLAGAERELERMVQWARGCEDGLVAKLATRDECPQ